MSIYGWRWWDINKDGSLRSVNDIVWPPNETYEAVCEFGQDKLHHKSPLDEVPVYGCTCGIWAFPDPEIASGLPHNGFFKTAKVFGVIECWGGIVHHELGFRAQYAEARAVCVLRGKLHPCYEIPRYQNIKTLCAEWDVEALDPETFP